MTSVGLQVCPSPLTFTTIASVMGAGQRRRPSKLPLPPGLRVCALR